MIVILAIYLLVIAVLVTKYRSWTPKDVFKVAVFIIPILATMVAIALTIVAGHLTRTNVTNIHQDLVNAANLIEDLIKNER